jgi:hypothetical protein
MSDALQLIRDLTLQRSCILQEVQAREESKGLSDDDLTIVDLHTTMSKIQQQRALEIDQAAHNKRAVKQRLLGLLSQSKEQEEQTTARMTIRTSGGSNATQVAVGSSFVLEGLDVNSASYEEHFKERLVCKDDDSCLVKIETEDLADQDTHENPKQVLLIALKTVFSSLPSPLLSKTQKSIETLANSSLVMLLSSSRAFLGLYRLNQTYSLLHKLAGYENSPSSFPCSAVKMSFTFSTLSLSFIETNSSRVTSAIHAVTL